MFSQKYKFAVTRGQDLDELNKIFTRVTVDWRILAQRMSYFSEPAGNVIQQIKKSP